MTLQARIARLQEATANGIALEHLLLHEPILTVAALATKTPHSSSAYLVVFSDRQRAVFKPFDQQHITACRNYNQHPHEAVVHEVVAWRLAHALGEPWYQLVPTAVLRELPDLGGGVLVNFRTGTGTHDVFADAPAQARAAALWDALIGQQDRHMTNFRYDPETSRLALIDNAFAFARPGDFALRGGAIFEAWRRSKFGPQITPPERAALDGLLASGNLHGLRDFLPEDRADALERRAARMLECGCLPLIGAF